jgi:hypothetical protein
MASIPIGQKKSKEAAKVARSNRVSQKKQGAKTSPALAYAPRARSREGGAMAAKPRTTSSEIWRPTPEPSEVMAINA